MWAVERTRTPPVKLPIRPRRKDDARVRAQSLFQPDRMGLDDDSIKNRSIGGEDLAIPALVGDGPVWQKNEEASSCNGCGTKFSFLVRRHHCRSCGYIFCDLCCPKDDHTKSRVCTACLRLPVDHASVLALWEIGSGTFGTVNAGLLPDGRWCAIKCISVSGSATGTIRDVHKEIGVMKSLQHPHIVQYLGSHLDDTCNDKTNLYIFLEYISGGALSLLLPKLPDRRLPLEVARVYTRHIVEGLEYLHKSGIAHRDVKCQNILVCFDTGAAKVADFGTAWKTGKHTRHRNATTFVGTPHWMAPEVLITSFEKEGYNAMKADVWSLGCTVVEMVTGRPAWNPDLNPVSLMVEMERGGWPTGFDPDLLPQDVQRVLALCFDHDPSKRASMSTLRKQPFLRLPDRPPPSRSEGGSWQNRRLYPFKDLSLSTSLALLSTGEVVAVKRTIAERKKQEEAYASSIREMSLLRELQHKYIVGFYGSIFQEVEEDVELKLFLEFVTGGCLKDLLHKMPGNRLPDSVVRVYTRHLLHALVFLHDKGVAHRNIATSTILVSQNTGLVKLSNFTEATDPYTRSARQNAMSLCGPSVQVVAPEMIDVGEEGYDPKKPDIWSIGCVVAEMHTGNEPWKHCANPYTMLNVILMTTTWPDNIDPDTLPIDLSDFLSNCFQRRPVKRATAQQLLQHRYSSLRNCRYE